MKGRMLSTHSLSFEEAARKSAARMTCFHCTCTENIGTPSHAAVCFRATPEPGRRTDPDLWMCAMQLQVDYGMIISRENGTSHHLFEVFSLAAYGWFIGEANRDAALANEDRFLGKQMFAAQDNISDLIEEKINNFNQKLAGVLVGILATVIIADLVYSRFMTTRKKLRRVLISALKISEGGQPSAIVSRREIIIPPMIVALSSSKTQLARDALPACTRFLASLHTMPCLLWIT